MKKFPLISLLVLTTQIFGCASMGGEKTILQSWLGEDVERVFMAWGASDRQTQLKDDKVLHEWFVNRQYVLPGSTVGQVNIIGKTAFVNTTTTGGGTITGSCRRSLIVDQYSVVVDGSSSGADCCVMAVAGYCASLLNTN